MELVLPEQLHALAKRAPFPLYAVGGAVRDALAGLPATDDIDLCAPADADAFSRLAADCGLEVNGVYRNTGTVNLTAGGAKIEFTSFRSDFYRGDGHAPARVTFTDDMETDARRRDFRCNAVYCDLKTGEICDPLNGRADIAARRLTATREPVQVFSEDGLRLLRLARLSAQLGFSPDGETLAGARASAKQIDTITAERIFAELQLILHADGKYGVRYAHYEGLKLLDAIGVLERILPELTAGRGLAQRADFHAYDVLEHSLRACRYADPRVRLSALLHDVGKPAAYAATGKYHGHDAVGEPIGRAVLQRLKAPKKTTETVCRMIALHMFDLDGKVREGKVRAFLVKNADVYELLCLVKQADFSGCKDDLSPCPTLKKWEEIRKKMVHEGVPFTLKELAVKGDDLASFLPARRIGEVLNTLLLRCAQGALPNRRDALLREAARMAEEER